MTGMHFKLHNRDEFRCVKRSYGGVRSIPIWIWLRYDIGEYEFSVITHDYR